METSLLTSAPTTDALVESERELPFISVMVSEEDICDCGSGLLGNPIARALSRATKVRWRVWDGRIAQPVNSPHHVVELPAEVREAWEKHADLSKLTPFTFQLPIDDGDEKFAA